MWNEAPESVCHEQKEKSVENDHQGHGLFFHSVQKTKEISLCYLLLCDRNLIWLLLFEGFYLKYSGVAMWTTKSDLHL